MRRIKLHAFILEQMPPQNKPVDSLAHYMKMKKKERKQEYDWDLNCYEGGKAGDSEDETDDEAKERGKRRRKCSGCGKMTFHNIRTCPDTAGRARYYRKKMMKFRAKTSAVKLVLKKQ